MPVTYNILPEKNLIIYFCSKSITSSEFFKVAELAGLDPRYSIGQRIIIDFFNANFETSLSDLKAAVAENQKVIQRGGRLGKTAVISKSASLKFMRDALMLLAGESLPPVDIFSTAKDALKWLDIDESCEAEIWESSGDSGMRASST